MFKISFFLLLFLLNGHATDLKNTSIDRSVISTNSAKSIQEGSGQISGRLFEKDTGDLIGNAANLRLFLFSRVDESGNWENVADVFVQDSSYVFSNLGVGEYALSISSTFEINQENRPLYLPTLWNSTFQVISSLYNIPADSILTVSDGAILENIDFRLTPAALLYVTDDSNNGEAFSRLKLINSDGELLNGTLSTSTVIDNGVAETVNVLFNYLPIGDYRFYVHSESEFYNTQSYVDFIYGSGDCYACELELIEGKGELIHFDKFDKKVINVNRSQGASISGKLTFEENQLDFQTNSIVYLRPMNQRLSSGISMSVSDVFSSNGEYQLSGIAAGEYRLSFHRNGFISQSYKGQECLGSCDDYVSYPIRIGEGEHLIDVDVHLRKGGSFHGMIVDASTEQGLEYSESFLYSFQALEILNEDLSIAAIGYYTTGEKVAYLNRYGLPEGNYYIKTGVSSNYRANGNYINQVYPAIECEGIVCDFSQAELVHLGLYDNVEINFSLNRGKFITGKVVDFATDQGIENIDVVILNQSGTVISTARTDVDGVYKIGGLKSGGYYVHTQNGNKQLDKNNRLPVNVASSWVNKIYPNQRCLNNNCTYDTSNLIVVNDVNVDGIDFALEKGFSINGKITSSIRNIGLAGVEIKLYSEQGEYIQSYFSDTQGYYKTAALAAGNYKIVTANNNHYVNQVFGGGQCGLIDCNPSDSSAIAIGSSSLIGIDFALLPATDYYPQLSGLWYNPEQSGHGFQIEVIQSNGTASLLVSWYAMLNGEPIWLIGTGPLNKELAFVNLTITNGTNFPPNFNAGDVQRVDWGLLKFRFDDDNNTNISWETEIDGFSNGSMTIQRLSNLSHSISQTDDIDACLSGTFYNQEQSGHGIMLEVLGESADRLVLTWFVYNQGEQFWLLANGPINGTSATIPAQYTTGSTFPPHFVAADVQRHNWGDITVDKINNDTIRLSWRPNLANQSFGAGSIEMQRLTHIENINCD